ncbi:MAG TPA: MerR family transcriptional regulator [Gemmatimonadaceae bacterium]|nr:MerR family transcriptional regulator [Gemmatimonadaceae bacterium]
MLTIHELARRGGVPTHTVHYYRRHGLVSPPRAKGNRYDRAVWGPEHVRDLRWIAAMQAQGLSRAEIKGARAAEMEQRK